MSVALQRLNPKKNAVAAALYGQPKHLAKKNTLIQENGQVLSKNSNFYDVSFNFQEYGVGKKFTRARWKHPDCYWTVTKVVPSLQVISLIFTINNITAILS